MNDKEYKLELSGGIGDGRWFKSVFASSDRDAINESTHVITRSKFGAVADYATLWNDNTALMRWNLSQQTILRLIKD